MGSSESKGEGEYAEGEHQEKQTLSCTPTTGGRRRKHKRRHRTHRKRSHSRRHSRRR